MCVSEKGNCSNIHTSQLAMYSTYHMYVCVYTVRICFTGVTFSRETSSLVGESRLPSLVCRFRLFFLFFSVSGLLFFFGNFVSALVFLFRLSGYVSGGVLMVFVCVTFSTGALIHGGTSTVLDRMSLVVCFGSPTLLLVSGVR